MSDYWVHDKGVKQVSSTCSSRTADFAARDGKQWEGRELKGVPLTVLVAVTGTKVSIDTLVQCLWTPVASSNPYSDYGGLEGDIWRAIRLVVDTGVHSKHWTRQQMVDYFHDHSSVDETNIQSEVDRHIAWPGQALGYKMGQLKLIELRERSQKALGAKFDIRKFHDIVIDSGALPLDVLDMMTDLARLGVAEE
jgi:hypothetical protein